MTIKNLIALSGVTYIYNVTTIQITTVAIKSLISSIIVFEKRNFNKFMQKIDSAHHSQKRKRNRNNKY